MRLAFDDAAVVAHDLGYQSEAETASAGFGADEGIEQVRPQIRRHAGTRVSDADLERQGNALA